MSWYPISVRKATLKKLEEIKKRLEESKKWEDERISFDRVIRYLIEHFEKSDSEVAMNSL